MIMTMVVTVNIHQYILQCMLLSRQRKWTLKNIGILRLIMTVFERLILIPPIGKKTLPANYTFRNRYHSQYSSFLKLRTSVSAVILKLFLVQGFDCDIMCPLSKTFWIGFRWVLRWVLGLDPKPTEINLGLD